MYIAFGTAVAVFLFYSVYYVFCLKEYLNSCLSERNTVCRKNIKVSNHIFSILVYILLVIVIQSDEKILLTFGKIAQGIGEYAIFTGYLVIGILAYVGTYFLVSKTTLGIARVILYMIDSKYVPDNKIESKYKKGDYVCFVDDEKEKNWYEIKGVQVRFGRIFYILSWNTPVCQEMLKKVGD